jgi:hypothetical protein
MILLYDIPYYNQPKTTIIFAFTNFRLTWASTSEQKDFNQSINKDTFSDHDEMLPMHLVSTPHFEG